MARLSHDLSVGPTGLDERRDKFVSSIVEAEVAQPELFPNTIESGFERVLRDWKHAEANVGVRSESRWSEVKARSFDPRFCTHKGIPLASEA
jgi:hypothetical protein